MIKSMTAFASAERTMDDISVIAEIRTYNSRHLDIALRMTQGYQTLEEKIKPLVAGFVARGRVDAKIRIKDLSEEAAAFEIDAPKARAYYQALSALKDLLKIEGDPPLDLIAMKNDFIKPKETETDVDKIWTCLEPCVIEALEAVNVMRSWEGSYIANDFSDRLDLIKESIDTIEVESAGLLEQYRQRLLERIQSLAGDQIDLDEGRIEQEAAFLADKSDISEEITRVRSHLEQFHSIMDQPAPAGQKLNFLLQEINREFNTIGSKAGKARIAHLVVAVKSELEKIREQVQNVE